MKLRTRLGLVFVTSLVTLLAVLATTFWAYEAARRTDVVVNQSLVPSIDASRELMAATNRMLTAELLYPIDAAHREAIQARFENHRAALQHWLHEAERYADTPEETRLIHQIRDHGEALMAAHARNRALIAEGKTDQARERGFAQLGPHFDALMDAATALFQLNRDKIESLNVASNARFTQAESLAIGITIVGLLVAATLWWLTSRDIVAPLRDLMAGGEALASGRFVHVRHPAAGRIQELMSLQDAFNDMSDRLKIAAEKLYEANASLERQVEDRTAELATANRTLQAMVEELETLDKLKSNFMAVMSHELLTPLNFIIGFGSALEDELMGPLNDKQLDTVGKMLAGAERLTRMVRNTLEYTQLQAGTLEVFPEEVHLEDVVTGLQVAVAPVLAARRQKLHVELPAETPTLRADPDRLRQVLFELLDNASKFSPEAATVHLAASFDVDAVSIAVTDPGQGIPESAIADLFLPFYQADFTTTRAYGGMGLGLAIAHHLVHRMNGTLLIHSTPGEGTTVRVVLPRHAAAEPAPDQAEHPGANA